MTTERMRILVTGASGFVGKAVVGALVSAGHQVFAGSRRSTPVKGATHLSLDVTEPGTLIRAIGQTDPQAVLHLVGIIQEVGMQTFEHVHLEGTRNLLAVLPKQVRYLHMSALGADPAAPSRYSSSKGQAEALVRASGLPWTIFRPSLIFGPGDDFFGRVLKELVQTGPVVPQIGNGKFPFRPVSIQDVTQAFVHALGDPQTIHKSYDLVGPQEFSFRELLELEQAALGQKKPIFPVPLPLMNMVVPLMQMLPNPPITTDQYLMLKSGNTADPQPAQTDLNLPMLRLQDKLGEIVKR